jgi:hypothetical protein
MRPRVFTLLFAAAVLLVPAGCTSGGGKHLAAGTGTSVAPTSGGPSQTATPAGTPAPARQGVPAPHPSTTLKAPSGTVAYGWILATAGGNSIRVELADHLVNTPANNVATKYLLAHGGAPSSETPVTYVDVDRGVAKTFTISSKAQVTAFGAGTAPQRLDVRAFLTWLTAHFAKPLPVSARLKYQGAPHYAGPLWTMTLRGSTILAIGVVVER